MKKADQIQAFVETIWDWYSVHKRVLPWRDLNIEDDTQRAYMVMVSEIMLQQTQVERVKIVFKEFLLRFPTLKDLAEASNKEILMAWRGMGYNSRALRLRDAARTIVAGFEPVTSYGLKNSKQKNSQLVTNTKLVTFPRSMEQLTAIPGIGHYTAAAIRNFAFNIPTPCIDTNIRRILHRTFVGAENADGTWKVDDKKLLELTSEILVVVLESPHPNPLPMGEGRERGKSSRVITRTTAEWHAALMDFGSLVQTKRNPRWDVCPLTMKGLMKTRPSSFRKLEATLRQSSGQASYKLQTRKEPGRIVAGKHIPNRIFRGRIVEALRDHDRGLKLEDIGKHITVDWNLKEHKGWLSEILEKLKRDVLIRQKGKVFVLAD